MVEQREGRKFTEIGNESGSFPISSQCHQSVMLSGFLAAGRACGCPLANGIRQLQRKQGKGQVAMNLGTNKLESPAMTGYRSGMTSSNVIGSKLAALYGVSGETPRELTALLRALERKLAR